jgi:outer membrane protein TolC
MEFVATATRRRRRAVPRPAAALLPGLAAVLGGCALYHALPLAQEPDLRSTLPSAAESPQQPIPGVEPSQPAAPGQPVGIARTAALAVLYNPELRAVRAQAGVAQAEVFSAGLLPDPVVGLSGAKTVTSGMGLTNPYMIDVSQDLSALITRHVRLESKRAAARQTALHILWEEWQTAQAARLLYVERVTDEERLRLLEQVRDLFQRRYERSYRAYQRGDLTLETTGTDLTALLSANTRLHDLERQLDQVRHRLNALLGLRAEVPLPLAPLEAPGSLGDAEIEKALATLPEHRPDLLALQAGYASQEARVRQAILEQFPAVTIGGEHSRDNSDVLEWGLSLNISLPLFNGNRGGIAIERATRAELAATYQARLDDAQSQVTSLASRQAMLLRQQRSLQENLPELEQMAQLAEHAYQARNIGALTYLNLQNTLLDKRIELLDLQQAAWETRIALDTLLARTVGGSTPAAGGSPSPPGRTKP